MRGVHRGAHIRWAHDLHGCDAAEALGLALRAPDAGRLVEPRELRVFVREHCANGFGDQGSAAES